MAPVNWKLLTAFEAAARHGNFTRAAAELNVQQPAISRRVAALEAELGAPLLRRTRPTATLTAEGQILFNAVSSGLSQVRGALDLVRQRADGDAVTINTTIGFASCYLMKRLPAFRATHPETAIELVSRDRNDGYGDEGADIVIVFDHPDRLPGVRQALIFSEVLTPVARPSLASTIADDLSALARQPLLHLTLGIHGEDWRRFFHETGVTPPPPRSDHRFTSFMVCLQAALNGDGVMLGWETLMQDHLDLGQLTPVTTRRLRSPRGYFACLTARGAERPAALDLWRWLGALEEPAALAHAP